MVDEVELMNTYQKRLDVECTRAVTVTKSEIAKETRKKLTNDKAFFSIDIWKDTQGRSIEMILVIFLFNLIAISLQIKVDIYLAASTSCGKSVGLNGDDFRLRVDTAAVYFVSSKTKQMTSGAIMSLTESSDSSHSFIYKTSVDLTNNPSIFAGIMLEDRKDGKYELVITVRISYIPTEIPIYYHYVNDVMHWGSTGTTSTPFLQKNAGFLIGAIEVKVNGRKVIEKKDTNASCSNPLSWIPNHGIYHFNGKIWRTLYYFPHYAPQILS
ncbi:hypothetical protein Q1695_015520 [Nippostrongylus brasiliensis]|nr:hypothetical protein Q1695_015520 [Nippostrongylus brasiliensis]